MRKALLSGAGLALLLAGCSAANQPRRLPDVDLTQYSEPPAITVVQDKPKSIAEQMKGQTGIIELIVTDSGFQPASLSFGNGERVKLHLRNQGQREHNLVIPHFGVVTSNIAPGGENYVEFTANRKGDWPFFSDAPAGNGKPEPGLEGKLKVE